MAKNTKSSKPQKAIEDIIWDAANKLRGSVEPMEYKHVVLSLIFLKYANDKFIEQRNKLIADGQEAFIEMPMFYAQKTIFYIPENARWDYLMQYAKQADIALKIDIALASIESENASLKGALPNNYFSGVELPASKIGQLLDMFNQINLCDCDDKDIFGRIYEYCLAKFAIAEGKGKGEFYTPKSVVELLCELIEPYEGIIYDGACGSGGMFVQSMKFIERHQANTDNISVYGQEYTPTTRKLAMMNLAIRGISADIGTKAASTFQEDQHPDLKADFALMNPPFNQKDWREDNELVDDPRWKGYATPPTSNANYAWILNFISKLSVNGLGCLILSNGALSAGSKGNDEYEIRKQLIENDLVEAIIVLPRDMFYSTNISVTIWVFNKNKKARTVNKGDKNVSLRDRTNNILFMDLRQMGHVYDKKYIEFTYEDQQVIAETYHNWQSVNQTGYNNIKGFCYSATKEEVINNDYSLVTSKYIEFDKKESNDNFDEQMKKIQTDLTSLYKEEAETRKEIEKVLEELGYGIKIN